MWSREFGIPERALWSRWSSADGKGRKGRLARAALDDFDRTSSFKCTGKRTGKRAKG